MMDSCDLIGPETDQSDVLEQNIQVEGNLNFLVESEKIENSNVESNKIEQNSNVEMIEKSDQSGSRSIQLPIMTNVTNLEDIEGDQHVIKSDHYPYHAETVKFLESSKI